VTERETFRLAPPVIFWWVWVAFVAANVADYAVQGLPSARFGAVVGAILLLVTGVAYTLALRPKVIASADGITVLNPYRTHLVPWRLVTLVDTGEWVQVHYAPASAPDRAGAEAGDAGAEDPGDGSGGTADAGAGTGAARARGFAAASSASDKTVHCWALYVSARAKRKIASPPRAPRQPGLLGFGLGRGGSGRGARTAAGDWPGTSAGYASSRLPEEARYLASLPPAKAMAIRLDSRADRERARLDNSNRPPQATAAWSWPAIAAVAVPAVVLLAIALA